MIISAWPVVSIVDGADRDTAAIDFQRAAGCGEVDAPRNNNRRLNNRLGSERQSSST